MGTQHRLRRFLIKMQCFCSLTLFVCGCTRVSINIDVPLENHITSSSLLLPSSLGLCLYRLPFFLLLLSPNSHIFGLEASLILCLAYSETFSLFTVEMDISKGSCVVHELNTQQQSSL